MGMSNFLAFGTGALGAISKGFDSLTAAAAKQAEMDAEQTAAMERLGYARETSLMTARQEADFQQKANEQLIGGRAAEGVLTRESAERVAQIRAGQQDFTRKQTLRKNNTIIGDPEAPYFTIPKGKGGVVFNRSGIQNIMHALSNKSQYDAAMGDANAAVQIKRLVNSVTSNYKKAMSDMVWDGVKQKNVLHGAPLPSQQYAGILQKNPELLKLFKAAESSVGYEVRDGVVVGEGESVIAQAYYNGDLGIETDRIGKATIKTALMQYEKSMPLRGSMSQEKGIAAKLVHFTRVTGISTQNPDDDKFFKIATRPDIMQIFRGTSPTPKQGFLNGAGAWLADPENGFFKKDRYGNLTPTRDFFKAVNIYGRKNRIKDGHVNNWEAVPQITIKTVKDDSKAIKDKIEGVLDVQLNAEQALKTITELQAAVNKTGTGSGALISATAFLGAIPRLLTREIPAVMTLYRDMTQGRSLDDFNQQKGIKFRYIDKNGNIKEASGTVQDKIGQAFEIVRSGVDSAAVNAAKVEALQIILAYQMTSILQGGTGGRTISDQDITRTLTLFSGNVMDMDQRNAKLGYLRSLIQRTLDRGNLYREVEKSTEVNGGMWDTVTRTEALLNHMQGGELKVNNVDLLMDKHMVQRFQNLPYNEHLAQNTPQSMINLISVKADSPDFNKELFKEWAKNTERPLTNKPIKRFKILESLKTGQKLIFDYDTKSRIMDEMSLDDKPDTKTRASLAKAIDPKYTTNVAYDVDKNEVVKIKWTKEGSFTVVGAVEEEAATTGTLKAATSRSYWDILKDFPGGAGTATPSMKIQAAKEVIFQAPKIAAPKTKKFTHKTAAGKELPYVQHEFDVDDPELNKADAGKALKEVIGYSDNGAVAVLNNIGFETSSLLAKWGFTTKPSGETNVGALQWKGPRADHFIEWTGGTSPVNNPGANMLFLDEELKMGEKDGSQKEDYAQLRKHLRGEGKLSVDELTWLFAAVYLRPADVNLAKRGKKPSAEIIKLYPGLSKRTS